MYSAKKHSHESLFKNFTCLYAKNTSLKIKKIKLQHR